MGSSSSKPNKKDRVDSFDPEQTDDRRASIASQTDGVVGLRKSNKPLIEVNGQADNGPQRSPSPRGKRPMSSSSRASHELRRSSEGRNFLTKNGIKPEDARIAGNQNGSRGRSHSQNSSYSATSGGQQTEAQAANQNGYVLPGTIGTLDVAGTNYISNGPAYTQAYGQNYMAASIAHGGL